MKTHNYNNIWYSAILVAVLVTGGYSFVASLGTAIAVTIIAEFGTRWATKLEGPPKPGPTPRPRQRHE